MVGEDETLAAEDATDQADPLDVEGEIVQRLDLQAAVAQLSERDRELIGLRYGADLTAAQIAELLDSSRTRSKCRSPAPYRGCDRSRPWAPTCEVSEARPGI